MISLLFKGWQEIRYKKLATAMTTVGLLSNAGASARINPGGTRLGQYYCKDCDVSVNSPIQLQQHMTSAKHSAKLNGVETVKKKPGQGRFGKYQSNKLKYYFISLSEIPFILSINNIHIIVPLTVNGKRAVNPLQ